MINGFTVQNWKLSLLQYPKEDSFNFNDNRRDKIVAVADGVTRDPREVLPNINTFVGKLKFALSYPRKSIAKEAAEMFTISFPHYLREYNPNERDEEAVRKSFEKANKEIDLLRERKINFPDYLVKDFPGCVAAGFVIQDYSISYGFISDCGIAIIDEKGNVRFKTENQGPEKFHEKIWQDERLQSLTWENPQARKIIRHEYRNNPHNEKAFGVLTGEETAMRYVRTGTQKIKPGDNVIAYTDGLENIIQSGDFADLIRKNSLNAIKKLCKKNVHSEGTLVHAVIQSQLNYSGPDFDRRHTAFGRDHGYC